MSDNGSRLGHYQQQMAEFLLSAAPLTTDAAAIIAGANETDTRALNGLKVYRNNVMYSLTRALAAQFPVVEKLVGENFFRALARDYVLAEPPLEASLTWYGHNFADHISNHHACTALPYLPDVATLELLCQRALHAADAPVLQLQSLSAVAAEDMGSIHLHLQPSVFLFRSKHPVAQIWEATIDNTQEPVDITGMQGSHVLIYRSDLQVQVVTLQPQVWFLLQHLQQTSTLEAAWLALQQQFELRDAVLAPMLADVLSRDIFSHFTFTQTEG